MRYVLVLLALLFSNAAWAQACGTGQFAPGQLCANNTSSANGGNPVSSLSMLTITGQLTLKVRSSSAPVINISPTTDYYMCLDPTANTIQANLPPNPPTGLTYRIKDCTGQAAVHNITVQPAVGNIDGAPSFVITGAYQGIGVTYTGSLWSVN